MSSRRLILPVTLSLGTVLVVLACGDGGDRNIFGDPNGSSGASGGASNSSSSGFGSSSSGASGSSGTETCAATISNPAKAKVDIIFVIDDSGSMTGEMAQIKTNVNTFAGKIGGVGLDYTVTFIVKKGTSGNTICVPAPLGGAACADNPPTFFHVNQDVQSTDSLQLILNTYSTWQTHLRLDATKAFVEVTDDTSDLSSASFDTQLLAKLPAGMFGTAAKRNYIFHSIISKPFADTVPSSNICTSAAGPSVQYQELSKLTGGIIDEVCKTDYSGVLDNIAKGIVDKLGCELGYPTADAADPTKVVVQITPAGGTPSKLTQVTDASKCGTIADGWYYDDPAAPKKIILCPTTCGTANATAGSKVEALVGCKGEPPK